MPQLAPKTGTQLARVNHHTRPMSQLMVRKTVQN